MADEQFLSFKFDNEDLFGFLDNAKAELVIREWLHGIADLAEDAFYQHVPYASGRMAHAITQGRVNKTPYGYTVDIGIAPVFGLHYGESPEYPRYVEEGTGIFRSDGVFGPQNAIKPIHGNVIAFEKLGEGTVFTRWVQGQPAQRFMEKIETQVQGEIILKKAELAVMLNALT